MELKKENVFINKELDNVIEDVRKDISKASDNNEKKYLEKRRSKIPKK